MSGKKWIFLLLGCLVAVLVSGCNCTNAAVSVFDVLLDSPVGYAVVTTLNPTFTWHGSDTCEPDEFRIRVEENVLYGGDTANADVSGDLTAYTLAGDSLLPGREYAWYMQARNDYDPEESGTYLGPNSASSYFYTGPVCSGETLIAPTLQYPRDPSGNQQFDNWITHNHLQEFKWSYEGGCLPISFDYQFASDPGFADIVLSGTTTEPYVQHLFESFPDCTSLYWRVAANNGTSTGPWSDAWQFHWVVDEETCWQTHYISDDGARISVRLYDDICEMTGYANSGARVLLDPGCARESGSNLIHGDGEYAYPPDRLMNDFRVELGSGPCPSTGLDSRKFGGLQYFYVVAPGTYCVSITRDQEAKSWGDTKDLMHGMWTYPRTSTVVAGQTVELGSGIQDITLYFGWDEYEQIILWYPIPENINCRRGPDPICDPLKIPLEGTMLPILARDVETEWKLTAFEGELCYVFLPAIQIDEALAQLPRNMYSTADLPFYEPPPPCPTPTPEPGLGCGRYTSEATCEKAGCTWVPYYAGAGTSGVCTNP